MNKHYWKFAFTLLLSLGVMFVLMMSMIETIDHFYFNMSNFWMALIMVALMGIIMLAMMVACSKASVSTSFVRPLRHCVRR